MSGNQLLWTWTVEPMPLPEGVEDVVEFPLHRGRLPGDEGLRALQAVPELPPHDLPPHELLVAARGPSGCSSITFTTQSASVPVVLTSRCTRMGPATTRSSSRGAVR